MRFDCGVRTLITASIMLNICGPLGAQTSQPTTKPTGGLPASKPATVEIAGAWQGTLEVGAALRLVVRITRADDGALSALLDSPDQGANSIPISSITFANRELKFESARIGGAYSGILNASGELEGAWSQGGRKFSLNFKKLDKAPDYHRPQEPGKPYPYKEEEVSVDNKKADVKLAGTLTLPEGKGPFAAVVLVTGSGPQDRDEALMGHKPFLILADHLTRKGVAVLRCDDRGIGKSTGTFATATSEDFAGDALACVDYLKTRPEINAKKIGVCGHSEGGLIAPMCAARSSDVSFIVMMAGTGVPGDEILYEQGALIARAGGADEASIKKQRETQEVLFKIVKAEPDPAKAEEKLRAAMEQAVQALSDDEKKKLGDLKAHIEGQVKTVNSAWFRMFVTLDPRTNLTKVKCPVLAINGEKDLQVPPKQNLPEIEKALKSGGNTHVTIKELPSLNHLFQTARTGAPSEYSQIDETMAPAALEAIATWVLETTK